MPYIYHPTNISYYNKLTAGSILKTSCSHTGFSPAKWWIEANELIMIFDVPNKTWIDATGQLIYGLAITDAEYASIMYYDDAA